MSRRRIHPRPYVSGGTALVRPVDSVGLPCPYLAPHCPLGRVRLDALLSQTHCKLLPPVAKRRFAYIEPDTLFADRFHDEVNVRISLMGMQRHSIAMLKRESVHRECPYRRRELVRWGCPLAS